ncbi:MAG TPA: hypothetical protein DDZ51_07605 [Planctomycetaceae bacterium]|nr:hypothetical protein [Planctomycetaceae bacterium]
MTIGVLKNICIASLFVLFVAGCGGSGSKNPGVDVHPVTGKVTVDGAPLAGATIIFKGSERGSSGITDAQGVYTLMTFDPGDGVPAGSYKVAVIKQEIVGADNSYSDVNSPNYGKEAPPEALGKKVFHVAEKFGSPDSSGLTATVKEGKNEINFEVTSK